MISFLGYLNVVCLSLCYVLCKKRYVDIESIIDRFMIAV